MYQTNTAYPNDQLVTDSLQWVKVTSNPIFITPTSQTNLLSRPYGQTALNGFRFHGRFNPLVAFGVACTSLYNPALTNTVINYDRVMVNEGGGWNSSTNAFTAPFNGVYFISVTMAVPATGAYGS